MNQMMSEPTYMEQVPAALKFSEALKPLAIKANRNVRRYFPESGANGYSGSGSRQIRIPISASNALLDTNRSVLSFDLTIAGGGAGNAYVLSNSAYDVIQNIRILDGGNNSVLEDLGSAYNQLANRIVNLNLDGDRRRGVSGGYMGLPPSINYGAQAGGSQTFSNDQNVAPSTRTYHIPIICSGIMNTTSEGSAGLLLPIGAPLCNGIVIEINLEPNAKNVFDGAVDADITYTLNRVSYDATVVNVESSLMNAIAQAGAQAGGIFWSTYTWSTQEISVASSEQASLNVNARPKSLKSLLCLPRLTTQNNTVAQNYFASPAPLPATGSANGGTLQIQSLIGSVYYPQAPLMNYSQVQTELQNALGSDMAGVATQTTFETAITGYVAGGYFPSQFTIGIDYDSMPNKEELMAGLDLSTNSTPLVLNLNYGAAAARTYVVGTHYDLTVKLDPVNRMYTTSY